jgi:putative membrane protein
MNLQEFPALNASLNGAAAVFMTAGFVCIRQKKIAAHRACMLSAFTVSTIFLACYVYYHVKTGARTPFGGTGVIRSIYFAMLISHVLLATAIAYLVPRTLLLALGGDFVRHRAWARWTFPIWYYVSITGVLVYFFLYQWWPAAPR